MNFDNASKTDSPPVAASHSAQTKEDDNFDVAASKNFNSAMFICWLVAFLAIAGSIFFWLLNRSAQQAIETKTAEKQQIISEISSPSLSDIEFKATSFKSAVTQLAAVSKSRYSTDIFLTKFYTRIAQNVKVANLSVTSDGKITMSGSTVSYRAVADQTLLLKEWKINNANILKDVKLMSVAETVNETSKAVEVTFMISGTIDKTQSLSEKSNNSTSDSSSNASSDTLSTQGGSNESNQ